MSGTGQGNTDRGISNALRVIRTRLASRRGLITLGLVGWVILIVIGAGRPVESDDWLTLPDLGGILLILVGLLTIVSLIVLVVLRPVNSQRGRATARKRSSMTTLLVAIALVLLIVALAPRPGEEPPPEPDVTSFMAPPDSVAVASPEGGVSGADVTALLLIAGIALAVIAWSARSGQSAESAMAEEDVLEQLGPAIDAAAKRLQLGSDPRSAVLASYAGLEGALAQQGEMRRPNDTPAEHLERALAAVPEIARPAVHLGRLYEIARFSDHTITEDDRRRAATALERARRTLASAGDGQ